ncbi:MAG: ATP-binding cassette domain-containing protein [Thermodesulfobacteriota bacterium]
MIKAINLTKSFGSDCLLDDISFDINSGERIGLVGRNGHGKTTLLRMIIGEETYDQGTISIPRGYRVGYVSQHLKFTRERVLDEGCLGLPEYHRHDTWRVEKVLAGLGFSKNDMDRAPAEFSGGFQVRLNLAKAILAEPNLLLLDEPTNYLDVVSIRWLAAYLKQWPRELLLITHDRSFMDQVITHTLGIHRKKIRKIPGNTEKYYGQIQSEEEVYEKTRVNEEKKRKETELFIQRFRAKARLAGLVQSRIKALEKQTPGERLAEARTLDFSFSYAPLTAKHPLQVESITFGYEPDRPLIRNLNLAVNAGDRIGVIGKNGSGKTTLLRILAGDLAPDRGQRSLHPGVRIAYYAQTNTIHLNDALTVEEEVMNAGCQRQRARDICGTMMFEKDNALKKIGVLSGGEKSRVLLGKIIATPSNLLMLDEPTNHLDMDACEAFLDAISQFEGTVILVTHNEMFLHALANRLLVFQSDGVSLFEGGYADFLERVGWEDEGDVTRKPSSSQAPGPGGGGVNKKALRKRRADIIARRSRELTPLKKRLSELEAAIIKREESCERLNMDMVQASEAGDGKRIARLSREYNDLQSEIERLYKDMDDCGRKLSEKEKALDREAAELEE